MSALPTARQVRALPAVLSGKVLDEHIDINRHMNIQHYVALAASGLVARFRRLGFSEDYVARTGQSLFVAEHHIRYLSELTLGTPYSVHARVLDRSRRSMHTTAFLLDDRTDRLSATVETVVLHVGMESRSAEPFSPDIAAAIDAAIDADRCDWPAPLSGSMGIRRDAAVQPLR
jgi:acyl-CoA thioester hydrolase